MSNKQPTAVEWLYNELFYFLNAKSKFEDSDQILDKAKEMEKEYYTEFEVLQLLLKLQQTESYDNLYDWFQENKKQTYGGNK
jgi:hypothetical protein